MCDVCHQPSVHLDGDVSQWHGTAALRDGTAGRAPRYETAPRDVRYAQWHDATTTINRRCRRTVGASGMLSLAF